MSGRLLITQSLLSAWAYQYKAFDPEAAHADFVRTLQKEYSKPNKAMLDGIQFENMVTAYCDGNAPPREHEWRDGIIQTGDMLKGCQFQVKAYRDAIIDRIPFLLYGRLDGLRAGTIFDLKFSKTYEPGKYLSSVQHPMYFACVPEATRFDYLVYTGKEVCRETYQRTETEPIENVIKQFVRYLEDTGLDKIYTEKWRAK